MTGRAVATPRTRRWWGLPAILALTSIAFWPALAGGFVRDDRERVLRHPAVAGELSPAQLFEAPEGSGPWQPLVLLTWRAGRFAGGGSPIGFHALSLCAHLLAVAAALGLARRLAQDEFVALFAALLFGLHPVQVESVAWTEALGTPLAGLFAIAALDAFLRWRARGAAGVPWLAGLSFACGLLASELAVAVLPLAAALDIGRSGAPPGPVAERFSPAARAYAPFLAALLLAYAARAVAFGDAAAGLERFVLDYHASPARAAWMRVEVLGGVIGLLAWPFRLEPFRPFVLEPEAFSADTLAPVACLAALGLAVAVAWRRGRPPVLAALLWIPAAVLPAALRLRTLGPAPLADRLGYLAAFGFALVLALALVRRLPRALAAVALAGVAALFAATSRAQTAIWRDDAALAEASRAAAPESATLDWRSGQALLERYREEADPELLAAAFERFQDALDRLAEAQRDASVFATREDHIQANLGLAWCLWHEAVADDYHDYQLALGVFEQVATRYPEVAEAYVGMALAQTALGQLAEAEASLEGALERDPRSARAWHNLGQVRMRRGEWRSAAEAFASAEDLRPGHLEDLVWRARASAQAGDLEAAREALAHARAEHPSEPAPLVIEGNLAAAAGDIEVALQLAHRALELDPDDGEALLLKGKLHAARDERASAMTAFQRACELLPESFEAHYNAGALILSDRGVQSALPYLARAYRLRPQDPEDPAGRVLAETLAELEIESPPILVGLAEEDLARGRPASALEWVERALGLRPEWVEALVLKGTILGRAGDTEAAAEVFRRACELDPEDVRAHALFGDLLHDAGRGGEALYYLERAAILTPSSDLPPATRQSLLESLRARVDAIRESG